MKPNTRVSGSGTCIHSNQLSVAESLRVDFGDEWKSGLNRRYYARKDANTRITDRSPRFKGKWFRAQNIVHLPMKLFWAPFFVIKGLRMTPKKTSHQQYFLPSLFSSMRSGHTKKVEGSYNLKTLDVTFVNYAFYFYLMTNHRVFNICVFKWALCFIAMRGFDVYIILSLNQLHGLSMHSVFNSPSSAQPTQVRRSMQKHGPKSWKFNRWYNFFSTTCWPVDTCMFTPFRIVW